MNDRSKTHLKTTAGVAFVATSLATAVPAQANGHVILVHGLARTTKSMEPMAKALQEAGFQVVNLRYPTRAKTIPALTDDHLAPAVQEARDSGAEQIHFVTHSLGGIVVRDYLSRHRLPELGRVVMLAPPNKGSEVVDKIGHWPAFKAINGPAGQDLGTAGHHAPNALGPVTYPVGIIAGDRSINWINTALMIKGHNDGKVSVENTKVEGMTDHVVVHRTHPMIMKGRDTIALTLRFLTTGSFAP